MRNILLGLTLSLFTFATGASAAPRLQQGSIVNAASFAVDGAPNAAIAQGSLFSVFGVDIGPTTAVNVEEFPLPTSLGDVSIRISANGQHFDCPMIFAVNSQVSAILPSNVPAGTATLELTYNGEVSNAITFPVVAHMAGVFSRSSTGSGQSVIQNYISPASQPVNAINEAAQPGQVAILWATGLGASRNGDDRHLPETGDLLPRDQVHVYVGGAQANVEYAGRSGCCAGVDQVNFVVPANVEGCFVPVVVTLNGIPSNFTNMAIKDGGTKCDGAFGLNADQLDQLSSKQTLRTGTIALTRTRTEVAGFAFNSEVGTASFVELNGLGLIAGGSSIAEGSLAPNSCVVSNFRSDVEGGVAEESPNEIDAYTVRNLDAGTAISIAGPSGQKQLAKVDGETGNYFGMLGDLMNPYLPSTFLTPGTYNVGNGAGGTDVGAFSFSKNVPIFVDWSNRAAINNISRSQPLTITWSGGQAQSGVVVITGTSYSVPQKLASAFFCYADSAAGTFTVPSYVMNSLVASDGGGIPMFPAGTLNVGGSITPGFFEAPGLDLGVLAVSAIDSKTVNFQ